VIAMTELLRPYRGWTEDELKLDIQRIGGLLHRASTRRDERARCAASYLGQVLRDREETLATLRAKQRRLI
jgi:hypothetical protein